MVCKSLFCFGASGIVEPSESAPRINQESQINQNPENILDNIEGEASTEESNLSVFKGPLILSVKIIAANHLPKIDRFGSIDPFCQIEISSATYQTSVKKNTYQPEWEEVFLFEVMDTDSEPPQVRFILLDWERVGRNRHIGDAIIESNEILRILQKGVGSIEQKTVQLKSNNKPIIGNDKQEAEVYVELSVLQGEEEGAVEADPEAKGARRVEVTILNAQHLPKMDAFGSIDPYCDVEFGGTVFKTSVKKNTYSPTWDEVLTFDVEDVGADPGPLRITLMDWDRVGESEKVGMVVIPAPKMYEVVRGKIGWSEERIRAVRDGGKAVVGQDKQGAVVGVRLRVLEAEEVEGAVEADPEAKGARRMEICLVSFSNFPDFSYSDVSSDFFFSVSFAGCLFDSVRCLDRFPPDFSESFLFYIEDILVSPGPLSISVMSCERFGATHSVGSVTIAAETMWSLLRARADFELESTRQVTDRGKPVMGQGNGVFSVRLRARVKPPEVFALPRMEPGSAGPRRLQLTVTNAQNLPNRDKFGAIDPICDLEFAGCSCQTGVKKCTGDPEWGDTFLFDVPDIVAVTSPLRITLLDCRRSGDYERVGSAFISAQSMAIIMHGKVGWNTEATLQLLKGGRLVVGGKGRCFSTVCLRLSLLALEDDEDQEMLGDKPSGGPRQLEVAIEDVEDLDLPRTGDPTEDGLQASCTVEFQGAAFDTAPRPAYGSKWGDIFLFSVDELCDRPGGPGPLRVVVECCSRHGPTRQLGEVVIPADTMGQILRHPVGWEQCRPRRILDRGRVIAGSDGREGQIRLRLRVSHPQDECLAVAMEDAETAATQRRLEVTVVGAERLPQMVGRDAFCHVHFAGSEFATRAQSAESSVAWGDVFTFELAAAELQPPGPLRIIMLSWETHGGSRRIGSASISATCMRAVASARIGWQANVTLRLTDGGRVIIGQGRSATEVSIRLAVRAAAHGFDSFVRVEIRLRLDHERGARAVHPGQADVDRLMADVVTDVATALDLDPTALRVSEVRGRLTCAGAGAARRLAGRPTLLLDVSSDARSRSGLGPHELALEIIKQAEDPCSALHSGKYTNRIAGAAIRDYG